MTIIQTIAGGVTAAREFVTGLVRDPAVAYISTRDPTGVYVPDIVAVGGGGYYDPNTGKVITKGRLELMRRKEAIRRAGAVAAEATRLEAERLTAQREERMRLAEERAERQKAAGALPTAEFYEKRLEEQYGEGAYSKALLTVSPRKIRDLDVEPKLISPFQEFYAPAEKPKPSVKDFFTWLSESERKAARVEAQVEKYELETPYSKLLERGMMPSLVRKGFYEAGEKFVGVTSLIIAPDITKEQKVKGGVIVGTIGMTFFFSPVMATGATMQEELTRTRFTPLAKEKAIIKLGKIEKQVVMKKTLKAQLKYLAKEKAKLKTPEARAGFEKYVKEVLVEKGIIKIPTYRVGIPDITFAVERIPEMKEVGAFVGGVTTIDKLLKQPRFEEKIKLKEPVILKEKVITIQKPREREAIIVATITTPKLRAPQAIRVTPKLMETTIQIPVTRTIPKFKPRFPSPTISMKPTKPEKALPFLPRFLRTRKLEPRKKIIKVRRIKPTEKYKPSLVAVVRKIKAPRIPREYFRGMGALIVRPIISPRRRRKKK